MFAKQFDLWAFKRTDYILKVSITKDGITEEEIRIGLADGTINIDVEKREIRRRRNGELLAKYHDVELPVEAWSIKPGAPEAMIPTAIIPDSPSGSQRASAFFGEH